MIYLIDHEDSFTFNLAHLLGQFEDVIVSNYYNINLGKLNKASTIVLSPGPGEPKDYPITEKIYKKYSGRKKILGICLGFTDSAVFLFKKPLIPSFFLSKFL